jgi:hypothetical protein
VRFRPVRRFFLETPDMPLLFRRRALATLVSVIVLSATSSGQEATPREPSALLPGEIRLEVPVIDLPTLAEILGPILWMAIDEPSVALPAVPNVPCPPASAGPVRMPVDPTPSCRRAVYYQVRRVVFEKETPSGPQGRSVRQAISAKRTIDLSTITSLTMRYYFYYPREEGFKAHLHDLESAELDVEVTEHRVVLQRAQADPRHALSDHAPGGGREARHEPGSRRQRPLHARRRRQRRPA